MKKSNGSKNRFLMGIGVLFTIVSILNSCTKPMDSIYGMGSTAGSSTANGGSSGPGTNEVWIQNMAFNPSTITVAAGTTIKWTNKDAVAHTVTSNTGMFDSGTIATNGIYSFTITATGTFQYYCVVHPSMIASVSVN